MREAPLRGMETGLNPPTDLQATEAEAAKGTVNAPATQAGVGRKAIKVLTLRPLKWMPYRKDLRLDLDPKGANPPTDLQATAGEAAKGTVSAPETQAGVDRKAIKALTVRPPSWRSSPVDHRLGLDPKAASHPMALRATEVGAVRLGQDPISRTRRPPILSSSTAAAADLPPAAGTASSLLTAVPGAGAGVAAATPVGADRKAIKAPTIQTSVPSICAYSMTSALWLEQQLSIALLVTLIHLIIIYQSPPQRAAGEAVNFKTRFSLRKRSEIQ